MKITLFHPAQVPPKDYGGVERVVFWLAKGLQELGHEVHLGALKSSSPPPGVKLIGLDPHEHSAVDFLQRLPRGTEVLHFMAPPEEDVWARLPCKGLLTVHGNGKPGETFPHPTVFLSQDHAHRHGSQRYVYNGIDPAECDYHPSDKSNAILFLSKTSWRVKNVRGAIRYCARARRELWVAGGHRPLWPRIRVALSPRMRWFGPVNGAEKARLLSRAEAMIFPVQWPEPFGLVVVEALMSGTPVMGSRIGSLPELVPPQVGELVDPLDDTRWVEALSAKAKWGPEACRQWALDQFHYRKMAERYLEEYKKT